MARAGRDQLVRNACVAAANGGQTDCAPLLTALLDDPSAIVRGHAAWALGRLAGNAAGSQLTECLSREPDEAVRLELRAALRRCPPGSGSGAAKIRPNSSANFSESRVNVKRAALTKPISLLH